MEGTLASAARFSSTGSLPYTGYMVDTDSVPDAEVSLPTAATTPKTPNNTATPTVDDDDANMWECCLCVCVWEGRDERGDGGEAVCRTSCLSG